MTNGLLLGRGGGFGDNEHECDPPVDDDFVKEFDNDEPSGSGMIRHCEEPSCMPYISSTDSNSGI